MDNTLSTIFSVLNFAVLPLWLGLFFLPRKRYILSAIDVFAVIAAVVYTLVLIPGMAEVLPILVNPTLASVQGLLGAPRGAFAGWTHFLIFDLWVGRWISEDAHARHYSRLWVTPVLLLTLLFGPMGLLVYLLVRRVH
jgi:hypothetical protein